MTDQLLSAIKIEQHSANVVAERVAAVKVEAHFDFSAPSTKVAKVADEIHFSFKAGGLKLAQFYRETHGIFIPIPPAEPPCPLPNTYRPPDIPCIPPPRSRFRHFWATQPNVCPPTEGDCNWLDPNNQEGCTSPGLGLLVTTDPCWGQLSCAPCDGGGALPDCRAPITGASIATNDYVRGLVINILGTNAAQKSSKCGNIPGQRQGYWLDSITGDTSGSSIRYVPTVSFNTAQSLQFVQMQAQADLQVLIKYGVANQVTVTSMYLGNGTIGLKIVVEGVDDETTVVNSTMTKISNAWVWNS